MRNHLGCCAVLAGVCSLAAPPAQAAYVIQRVLTGLNQPMGLTQAPGDDTNLYIVERQGAGGTLGGIVKYNPSTHVKSTFLDLSGTLVQDGGALSMAFHPDFQTNGLFYVTSLVNSTNHLDEYKVVNGTPTLQRSLLLYNNLQTQHTINWIGFKPNSVGADRGYLYVTTGDGGVQADQANFHNYGQDLTSHMGKVLRIDVNGADAYPADANKNFGIPAGNPFVGQAGKLGEIYASGFRNPYRASFDRQTGDMYVGDVGFNTREEIDFLKDGSSGQDYGWAKREGPIQTPVAGVGGAKGTSLDPIYNLIHPNSVSITGGYVYRGPVPELVGTYFFADFVNNKLFKFNFDRDTDPTAFNGANVSGAADVTSMLNALIVGGGTMHHLTSFGEDNAGNLYFVGFTNAENSPFNPPLGTGEIFMLVPEPGSLALLGCGAASLLLRRRRR